MENRCGRLGQVHNTLQLETIPALHRAGLSPSICLLPENIPCGMSKAEWGLELVCCTTWSLQHCVLTGSYMRLIVKFEVQREVRSYLVQVYWPTVLTTILSWISFWMNYDSSAARVTIGKSFVSPSREETWAVLLRKKSKGRTGKTSNFRSKFREARNVLSKEQPRILGFLGCFCLL